MEAYTPMIQDAVGMFFFLGIELSVLFILISAGVSLLQQYIPDSKIQAILSGSGGRGYILAAFLGSVTPFCSCSTIPMLRGLLKAKAGFGPTLTFLFTSPLLNPIIVGMFIATFGMKVTVIYVSVALLVSIAAGVVLSQMHFEKYVIPENEAGASTSGCGCGPKASADTVKELTPLVPSCCGTPEPQSLKPSCCDGAEPKPVQPSCCGTASATSTSCCGAPELTPLQPSCCGSRPAAPASCGGTSEPKPQASSCCGDSQNRPAAPDAFSAKMRRAFRDGWTQFVQVSPYIFIGVLLGSVIYGFVPSEFIAKYASGDSLFAVPIAAVIGIPLYVRAEALIPLSAVLVSKGMGLGAVMALIVGGSGASLTELILLKSTFRTPMIVAFLVVILGMATVAGYLFQFAL